MRFPSFALLSLLTLACSNDPVAPTRTGSQPNGDGDGDHAPPLDGSTDPGGEHDSGGFTDPMGGDGDGPSDAGYTRADAGQSSPGFTDTARCAAPNLVWKSGAKTMYESYPEPGTAECEDF